MKRSVSCLATVFALVTAPAIGEPVKWTCLIDGSSEPFTRMIDADANTVDGERWNRTGNTLHLYYTASVAGITLDLKTGDFVVTRPGTGVLNQGRCTSETAVTLASESGSDEDTRSKRLQESFVELLERARAGKIKYVQAARQYQVRFQALYPDEAGNAAMNEYLAYMVLLGERIDLNKMTEAEAQYELARKVSELDERTRAQQLREAAARYAEEERAARREAQLRAAEYQAATTEAARAIAAQALRDSEARLHLEGERPRLERETVERQSQLLEQQRRDQRSTALLQAGIQLLTTPPKRTQTCHGRWLGPNYIQTCN